MPIFMLGHINILKMSILPKFLYLFQSIPLPLSQTFFCKLKKLFSNFIWNNRCPRLRLSLLHLPYDRGGLHVPNLQWYYWAAQLRTAMFYFSPPDPPAWLAIERTTTSGLSLQSYLYSAHVKKTQETDKKTHLLKIPFLFGMKHMPIQGMHPNSPSFPQYGEMITFPLVALMVDLNNGLAKV